MTRFAIIDAGRVTNIIEADADFAATLGAIDATGAGIGDLWDGMTFTTPPAPPVPASEVIAAIKAERDRRKFNGVKVGTKWLHTDTYSRTQWLGMVLMGASIPAIDWTTMDGTSVTTSQALAGQVFQGTAQLDAQLFGYSKALITQVEAAADPASVDIVTGWPATFEPA